MKKLMTLVLAVVMALSLFAFAAADEVAVMTYEEYAAAELDTEVNIETYVQASQSWWENQITLYTQDEDGAYFIYNCACSEEDAAKLVPGTKIRVNGFKSEWSGEVEIVDGAFEIIEDAEPWIAEATDVTELFGTDELAEKMNLFVTIKGAVVAPANDEGAAFLYKWNGSGEDGDDLYFNVTIGENTYSFTVESYLCGAGTEVYEAVKALNVGDVIDLEGFLYWYEGPQPHVTAVAAAAE